MEVASGMIEFTQDGNCCDGGFEILKVHVKDGGAGKFLVLETEQWGTNVSEMIEILRKVQTMFGIEEQPSSEGSKL